MKQLMQFVSLVALLATIVPCLLYFAGVVDHSLVKSTALIGSIVWFVATPIWMGRELDVDATEVEI